MVGKMIELYCKKNHRAKCNSNGLCPECEQLSNYAKSKIEKCPFMASKTFCSNCKVHCYGKVQREQIRQVMRFSGPRMLFYYPRLALWHVVCTVRGSLF